MFIKLRRDVNFARLLFCYLKKVLTSRNFITEHSRTLNQPAFVSLPPKGKNTHTAERSGAARSGQQLVI
jgi:hypothetical protein